MELGIIACIYGCITMCDVIMFNFFFRVALICCFTDMVSLVKRQFLYAAYEMVGVLYEEGDRENGRGRREKEQKDTLFPAGALYFKA